MHGINSDSREVRPNDVSIRLHVQVETLCDFNTWHITFYHPISVLFIPSSFELAQRHLVLIANVMNGSDEIKMHLTSPPECLSPDHPPDGN